MSAISPFGSPVENDSDDNFEINIEEALESLMTPVGVYKAKCVDIAKKRSKADKPMWVFDFAITTPGEQDGKEFKVFCSLSPSAIWKLEQTLSAMGIGVGGGPIKFIRADVVNKTCQVEIEDQEYEGKKRSGIAKCIPL